MVLNGLWLVVARFGPLWSTVLVIVLLLAVLARVIVLLGRAPARGWAERIVVDGTNGLHFGWVTIAIVWLAVGRLTDEPQSTPTAIAAIIVAVVIVLAAGVAVMRKLRTSPVAEPGART